MPEPAVEFFTVKLSVKDVCAWVERSAQYFLGTAFQTVGFAHEDGMAARFVKQCVEECLAGIPWKDMVQPVVTELLAESIRASVAVHLQKRIKREVGKMMADGTLDVVKLAE